MSITKYFKGSLFHTPTDGVLEYFRAESAEPVDERE